MREIKFRAWDKNEERMIYSGTEQNDYPFAWQLHNTGIEVVEHDGTDWNVIKNLVFEQYTGLKDKNGKEIYEGDVVTSEEYPFQDEGEFNYHGVIEWDEELTSYYLVLRIVNPHKQGISDGVGEQLQDYLPADLEIIGNIHENPEILEVSHETL